MSAETGSEFHIKLKGIKLPPVVEARISAAIQTTVMKELATTDIKSPIAVYMWDQWFGMWITQTQGPTARPQL